MFRIKYAGIHNINQHYFESDMQAGIDYDFLLFFHTPYCFGSNKNKTIEYPPNTMVYIPKYTSYYYCPVKNTSNELYEDSFIQFYKDEIFMNNTIIPPMKPICIPDAFWLIRLLEFVSYENYIKAPSSETIIDNSMRAILFLLHDALEFDNATKLNYQNKLQKLRKEIYERPDLSWNMDMIAEYLHLSTSYTHKIYKKIFGTSCAQDIINSRIQKSKYLLTYSNLSVSNISIECGYKNVEHFSRQFTKITGYTPSKYRNRNRQ